MKSNISNNQKILVFVCEEHKFAHIGVFNMISRNGKLNYSGSLNGYKAKAARIKRLMPEKHAKGTDSAFGNSFLIRLMNTGDDKWHTEEEHLDVELSEVNKLVKSMRDKYVEMGYSITGARGGKCLRQTGEMAVSNSVINHATKDRLYRIAEKLVEGISNINLRQVQYDIYNQYNYGGLDTRRKFFNFIHQNLDKYISK